MQQNSSDDALHLRCAKGTFSALNTNGCFLQYSMSVMLRVALSSFCAANTVKFFIKLG